MITIHIPPAALEAGARAIREFYSDEPVAVCDGVAYKAARAAFLVMVKAWPGVMTERRARCDAVVLPYNLDADLPQEPTDGK